MYMKLFKDLPLKFALFPFLLVLYRNFLAPRKNVSYRRTQEFLLTLGEFILSYLSRIALLLLPYFRLFFHCFLILYFCSFIVYRATCSGWYAEPLKDFIYPRSIDVSKWPWRANQLQPSSLCSKAERLGSKLSVGMIFLVILVHNMSGAKVLQKKFAKKFWGCHSK